MPPRGPSWYDSESEDFEPEDYESSYDAWSGEYQSLFDSTIAMSPVWDDLSEDEQAEAIEVFNIGFVEAGYGSNVDREYFFDYIEIQPEDFDWEWWAELYGATH